MKLAYPNLEDFAYLARHMRPDEIAQFLAFSGLDAYHPDTCARALAGTRGEAFALIGNDGIPIGVGGMEPVVAGTVQAWAMGTLEGWQQHGHAITRACRRMFARAFAQGANRVQILALASRTEAHRWYERGLRMQREGVLRGFASGQDVVMYARTKP